MTIECLGDLTAAIDVSGLPLEGKTFEERCQGGLLADGISGVFSGLATSMGVVTFSQITVSLLSLDVLIVVQVHPLIGGMIVFLLSSVATSGTLILGYLGRTRRDRVIVAASLAIALGVSLVPNWFDNVLPTFENEAVQGLMETIHTIVSTGYIIAGIISIFLNLILPYDNRDSEDELAKRKRIASGAARIFMDDESSDKKEVATTYRDDRYSVV